MPEASEKTETGGNLVVSGSKETKITLGTLQHLDVTDLSTDQIAQLRVKHAEGMIDLNRKGLEMQGDVGATSAALHTLASTVKQVSEAGDAVTVTHVQKNSLGQTEVIMGNTQSALKGKISRASRGESDKTILLAIIAAVVAIVLGIVLSGHVGR